MALQIGYCQYLFSCILYASVFLVGPSIFLHNTFDSIGDRIKASIYDHEDTFDFIVVGGGASGSVVANRLSESYKVLLLEAGGEPYPGTYIPGNTVFMLTQPGVNWNYKTVSQNKACRAMNDQASNWHRGLSLGGSNNLHYMMYLRGHPEDYNLWANITEDNRWKYENVLKYFKKSENFLCQDEMDIETSKYHSKDGPLTVKFSEYPGMGNYILRAVKELGYPSIDYNANYQEGFSTIQSNFQKNGYRMGAFQAFIEPIRKTRRNLSIYKFSHVDKVIFEDETTKVVGVQYIRHGQTLVAYAKNEVILSAGAISSPTILMRSGIGAKDQLKSNGIEVKVELPGVGKNLQDHIATLIGPFIINETVSYIPDRDLTFSSWADYYIRGMGPLNWAGVDTTGFVSSTIAKSLGQAHWPDLQFTSLGSAVAVDQASAEMSEAALNIKPGILQKYYKEAKGLDSFMIQVTVNRLVSRGEILLRSKEPKDPPLIDPKYLDNESDINRFVESIKFIVNMVENTQTFQALDGHLIETPFPGCENHKLKSDEYYECYARHFSLTTWHYGGSCAMGKLGSKNTVVNSELQVFGVDNLRIMDASVMPTVVSANSNAACIMIGELGADLLKKKYSAGKLEGSTGTTGHHEL